MSNAVSSSAAEIGRGQPAPRKEEEGVCIAVGESVGDYVIEERLGHGTEGNVFLARDILLGRRVALKTLRSATTEATHGVEEARLMAALEHPNIVRVYHAQRHKGIWLVVFEHIAGGSLDAHIERAGPLSPSRAVELLAQAAAGLGYAHDLGILHRDVKPQNLLLNHRGEIKLGDFGLALDARGPGPVRTGAVGTPAFLAPELWKGGTPSPASDIYSLGACLYFVLTGRVPFPFSSLDQLERAHCELTPKLPGEIPTGIRQAVLSMLAKDPALRPGPCTQLSLELGALARDPTSPLRSSPLARVRAPESPIVAGGAERALEVAWSEGPDRVYLERVLELLQQGRGCLQLRSKPAADGRELLRVALTRCLPSRRVALRLELGSPGTSLCALARQKAGAPALATLAQVCEQLAVGQSAVPGGPCVIEVLATCPPSERQSADLVMLSDAAAKCEIAVVLVTSADALFDAGSSNTLPGFAALHLPEAWLTAREFTERVRLWLSAATANRWDVSADALRLLRHVCREQGHSWSQLLQDSLLISAAARLPLVTTWSVQAALARVTPLHVVSDVPVEWRTPPRCWPSSKMSALLSELRQAERQSELRPAERQSGLRPAERQSELRPAEQESELRPAEQQSELRPAEPSPEAQVQG